MQKYRFKAKNTEGKMLRGVLMAKDVEALRDILYHHHYFLIRHRKVRQTSHLFGQMTRLKLDDLAQLCRALSFMLSGGIELAVALENLQKNTHSRAMRSRLSDVYQAMMEGSSLADAFGRYFKTFPKFFVNMIALGEASGHMAYVLERLADYYEREARTAKYMKVATFYPKILLLMVLGLLLGMSVFMMPVFTDLFEQFGSDIPALTRHVHAVTTFIRIHLLALLLGMVVVTMGVSIVRQTPFGQRIRERLSLNIPVWKELTVYSMTVRFASGFSVLVDSGTKLIEALETMGKLLGNHIVEAKFQLVASEIKRGKSLAESLEMIAVFPPLLIDMLKVGEESDAIHEGLDKTAQYFEEQVAATLKRMTTMVAPAFVMMIGGIILVVLLSIFGPMMDIMDTLGQTVG